MDSRELPDWLDAYLEYTTSSEPPTSYHIWCGLAVIAGALQRRVYLQQGLERTIYPNLYVILVGPSGRTRKGVALGIAKELLERVSTVSIAPESSSGREALILAMKRASSTFTDPTDGKIKYHCALSAFSEELSVFLGQGDIKFLANLTDWFDSKDNWAYETIGRGRDAIQGVCFNMVGGTAPEWIQSMLPREAIGGGYTARVIFIVEEWKKKISPDHTLTDHENLLYGALERDLNRINLLCGLFTFEPAAKQAYIDWYVNEDAKMRQGYAPVSDHRFAAYCERRTTHIRKVMMLLSASRGDSLVIEKQDFDRALSLMLDAESKMGKTFGGLGQARNSDSTEKVMEYIKVLGITTRKSLLSKFYRDVDSETLHRIESTMVEMGVITVKLLPKEGDKVYTWIKENES